MALRDGLISFYDLGEASGTRFDSHGSNHLTVSGSVSSESGKVGNATRFDANGDYLGCSHNSTIQVGGSGKSFTGCAWFYFDSVLTGAHLMGKWATSNQEWVLYRPGNAAIELHLTNDGSTSFSCYVSSGVNPSNSTWHFLAWWFDVSTGKANIQANNGTVVESSATIASVFAGNAAMWVGGAWDASTNNMRGRIDGFGLWNRVLTTDERTRLYNSGNGLSYSQIIFNPIVASGFFMP